MNALEVTNTCRKKRQARLHSSVTQSSADINYRVLKKKDIDCQDYQHACARHDDLYSDEVDIAAIDETNFDDLALQSADSSNNNYWEEPLSELAYNDDDDDDDDVPLFISKLT